MRATSAAWSSPITVPAVAFVPSMRRTNSPSSTTCAAVTTRPGPTENPDPMYDLSQVATSMRTTPDLTCSYACRSEVGLGVAVVAVLDGVPDGVEGVTVT